MIFYLILITAYLLILFYRAFSNAESIICKPPNKFIHIFAPPGVGKTTLVAKIVRDNAFIENTEEKKKVYSNVPIIGAIQLESVKDLGKYLYRDCIIILDEAGSELSNRNWHNNLDFNTQDYINKHRHYNADIYIFSQANGNIDNKFRDLVTTMFMLQRTRIPFQIKAHAIRKKMDLVNGQIVEFYEWWEEESFTFWAPPHWAYFNSYDIDKSKKPNPNEKRYSKLDLD